MINCGFTGRNCTVEDTGLPVKDLWVSSNKWWAKFSSSFALHHCHISQCTEGKHRRCTCAGWKQRRLSDWRGSAAPTRLVKTPIYGRPPKLWPNVTYSGLDRLSSGGATLHSKPFGLSHLSCNPPPHPLNPPPPKQKQSAAPPCPAHPCLDRKRISLRVKR